MRLLFFLFGLFFLLIGTLATANVPLLIWNYDRDSSTTSTPTSMKYLTKPLDTNAVIELLKEKTTPTKTIIIFLVNTLSAESLVQDYSDVSRIISSSSSSLIAPHTLRNGEASESSLLSLSDSLKSLPLSSYEVMFTNIEEVTTDDSLAIESSTTSSSSSEPRRIIVIRTSKDDGDMIFGTVELIKEKLKLPLQNLVFAFTGDASPFRTHHRVLIAKENTTPTESANATDTNKTAGNNTNLAKNATKTYCPDGSYYTVGTTSARFCFSHYVYATPGVITAIAIAFLLATTTLIGISALNGIQTPSKYPSKAPPLGKEY